MSGEEEGQELWLQVGSSTSALCLPFVCFLLPASPLPLSAMDKFKGLDKRATAGSTDVELESTHQNAVSDILPHSGPRENVGKFSTIGVDGRLVIWDCKSLEASIAGLRFQ